MSPPAGPGRILTKTASHFVFGSRRKTHTGSLAGVPGEAGPEHIERQALPWEPPACRFPCTHTAPAPRVPRERAFPPSAVFSLTGCVSSRSSRSGCGGPFSRRYLKLGAPPEFRSVPSFRFICGGARSTVHPKRIPRTGGSGGEPAIVSWEGVTCFPAFPTSFEKRAVLFGESSLFAPSFRGSPFWGLFTPGFKTKEMQATRATWKSCVPGTREFTNSVRGCCPAPSPAPRGYSISGQR